MPKKDERKTAGYILPNPVDGYPLKSICFDIPDVPEYRQAFWGQVWQLARWWTWEKSGNPGDTRATEAAQYWRQIIFDNQQRDLAGEGCSTMAVTDIRQNLELCQWQVEYDNSGEWVNIGAIYQPACSPEIPEPTPQLELQVVNCALEESTDGGETFTPIVGADWYRRTAVCPATEFWAQSANPRVWGELADGTDIYNLGIVSSNVELRAFDRNLVLRNGSTGSERITMWNTLGVTTMGRQVAAPTGVLGKVIITPHAGTMSIARLDANSAQSAPMLAITSNNTVTAKIIEYLRGTQLFQQWMADGSTEQTNDAVIYDYSNGTTNRREVGRIRAKRENPEVAQWHGTMHIMTRNFVNQYINIALGTTTDGLAATVGVLGALPVPRQVVTGDWQGNEAGKNLAQAMQEFGWITDNTTLGTTPEPTPADPNSIEFITARRCATAAGAMYLMVYKYYTLAIGLMNTFVLCDSTQLAPYMRDALPMFEPDNDIFFSYFVQICTAKNSESFDIDAHLLRIKDQYEGIAQLYYCALVENACLTAPSWDEFRLNVLSLFGEDDALHFGNFLSNFTYVSMADVNASGYFYQNVLPCEFEDCEDSTWARNWNFPTNSGSTDWSMTGGHYTSGQGWVADDAVNGMRLDLVRRVTRAELTCSVNTGDNITMSLYDLASGLQLDTVSGGGGVTHTIDYIMIGAQGIDGIQVRIYATDNPPGGGANGRLITACIEGNGSTPNNGETVGSCF